MRVLERLPLTAGFAGILTLFVTYRFTFSSTHIYYQRKPAIHNTESGKARKVSTYNLIHFALFTIAKEKIFSVTYEMSELTDRLDDQIFVRNLAYKTKEEDLQSLFESFGPIKRISVALDNETKQSRGYGFVAMAFAADAQKAVNELNGKTLNGRQIRLEFAAKRGADIHKMEGATSKRDPKEQLRHQRRKERALKVKGDVVAETSGEENGKDEKSDDGNESDSSSSSSKSSSSGSSSSSSSPSEPSSGKQESSKNDSSERVSKTDSEVRPGMQLLLMGVPAILKKQDDLKRIMKIDKKTKVELIKDGHRLIGSVNILTLRKSVSIDCTITPHGK